MANKLPSELSESLIFDCAAKLGASRIPVEAIQRAWKSVGGCGCLNTEDGQRLFIAYRLRELGCFEVGCQDDTEVGSGCWLNCFDIYSDTKNLSKAEYEAFMGSRKRYRENEAKVAATKLWKLLDSYPVNAVADRSTYFNRDSKKGSQ